MNRSPDFWGVVLQRRGPSRNRFRLTRGRMMILLAVALGLLWLVGAYIKGVQFQISGFHHDFSTLVNRNLLGPWEDGESFQIRSDKRCAPGTEPGWPRTRWRCTFVGGGVQGCPILTYGRSCAVIGVPKTLFDAPHFRESLRVALSDLCAVFRERGRPWQPGDHYLLYRGCDHGRAVSFNVYINVHDSVVEPPYTIDIRSHVPRKRLAVYYFSSWTKNITMISEAPR